MILAGAWYVIRTPDGQHVRLRQSDSIRDGVRFATEIRWTANGEATTEPTRHKIAHRADGSVIGEVVGFEMS